MSAKNSANLTKFVGVPYIRKAGSQWDWYELASARGVVANLNSSNQTVDIISDTRGSAFKWFIPEASISLTFIENGDTEVIGMLFWLTELWQAAGAKTITDQAYTFGWDTLVLDDYASDTNWVTSIVVKSADGNTTYSETTDYTVAVNGKVTTITRVWSWSITSWESVLVSGSVNVNESKSISLTSQFSVKDEFEVKIEAYTDDDSKVRTIKLNPATLESDYTVEFLDVVKAWDITGASLEFKLSEGGEFNIYDEILSE